MALETHAYDTTVAETMGRILCRPALRPDEDFFVSGADSLRAVELISELSEHFAGGDEELSRRLGSALLIAVFDDATPAALATVVRQNVE